MPLAMTPRAALRGLILMAPLLAAAQVSKEPLPTQLVCRASETLSTNVSHDGAGTPLAAGVYATSGTHECGVQTQGPASPQADGAWRFEWSDEVEGNTHYRATVRRTGADGYALALEPARCGTLTLPATATLSPKGKGCETRVDRDGAFVQFWRQLRDAVSRRDGEQLQRLSLPQLQFAEGPDLMKAPASIIRNAAPCLATVPTTDGRSDIGKLLAATDTPRLDMPPLSRRGDSRISAGRAMTALWTPQGWRLESFNADRATFSECKGS